MPFKLPKNVSEPLRRFACFDFSGGLDLKTSPIKLALLGARNKWLTLANNVVYDIDGSVRKRWGALVRGPVTTAHIKGGTRWAPSSDIGNTVDVVVAGTSVYKLENDEFTATLKTGLTSETRNPSFAIYNDVLVMANGVDAPQQWDGTTWSALGGSSPATMRWVVSHGNRLFALARTVPSRLYWSKLNNGADWSGTTDAGFMDVNPNDGGVLTSLVPGIQELVLLKTNRPYRLQGIGPTTGYTVVDSLVPTQGSQGCTASHASAFGQNQVFFASTAGVHSLEATHKFGDMQASFVSRNVEPYFQLDSFYAPYNSELGYSGFSDSPQLIYDAANDLLIYAGRYNSGSNACDRLLVYNTTLKAWAVWTINGTQFTSFWASQNDTANEPELRFGAFDFGGPTAYYTVGAFSRGVLGAVTSTRDLLITSGSPSTQGISATIRHISQLDNSGTQKIVRYIFLHFKEETSTTTMTLNLYADFRTTAAFTTTFDIASATAESQITKRIDVGGVRCEYLEVELINAQANKMFTFYGYEVHYRQGRTIHRAE